MYFTVLNSTPVLKDLCRIITPDYAAHWKVIGALLGLPTTCLDATETKNPTNLQWCCNNMLKMWLARNTGATWKDVLSAIDSPTISQAVLISSGVPKCGALNCVHNDCMRILCRKSLLQIYGYIIQFKYLAV